MLPCRRLKAATMASADSRKNVNTERVDFVQPKSATPGVSTVRVAGMYRERFRIVRSRLTQLSRRRRAPRRASAGHEGPLPGRRLRASCGIVSRSSNMRVDGGAPITERIVTGWPGRRAARCACCSKEKGNRRIEPDPQGHAPLAPLLQKI